MTYGATPQEWAHFDVWLGLTADLLPVVSNPNASIASYSDMDDLGKTPSVYDEQRHVHGIAKWTKKITRPTVIARWMREPDYGICLQTRTVRAIDCDTVDADKATAVEAFLLEQLGTVRLPRRGRANSAKFLYGFAMPGDFSKRRIPLDEKNAIEFLATGQQFIAVGTHPSGVRYEWQGGLPFDFPALEPQTFETLWSALTEKFGSKALRQDTRDHAPSRPAGPHALTIEDLRELMVFVPGSDGASDERMAWLRVIWALRSAWRESIGGALDEAAVLDLADEYSRRGDTGKYKSREYVQQRFKQGDDASGRRVSWRSLLWLAHKGGWRPTVEQQERINASLVAEFEDLTIGE